MTLPHDFPLQYLLNFVLSFFFPFQGQKRFVIFCVMKKKNNFKQSKDLESLKITASTCSKCTYGHVCVYMYWQSHDNQHFLAQWTTKFSQGLSARVPSMCRSFATSVLHKITLLKNGLKSMISCMGHCGGNNTALKYLGTSNPSFAQSIIRDTKENCEENMVVRTPGGERHVKGGSTA